MKTTYSVAMWVAALIFTAGSVFSQEIKTQAEAWPATVGGPGAANLQSAVPRFIKFSGTLQDMAGKPIVGVSDVTFALYTEEAGGTALWYETQTIDTDSLGRYTVLLGAMHTNGVPVQFFASGQARWLGVQVGSLPETAQGERVLLVSVPYALKAMDAETLGGKPASAYMLAPTCSGDLSSPGCEPTSGQPANPGATGGPTANLVGRTGKTQPQPLTGTEGQTSFAGITTGPLVSVQQGGTGLALNATAPGAAIQGSSTATTGSTYGVKGLASSSGGIGVLGSEISTTGGTLGMYGQVSSPGGIGILGEALSTSGGMGIISRVHSPNAIGLIVNNFNPSATSKMVSIRNNGTERLGVDASGNLTTTGNLIMGGTLNGALILQPSVTDASSTISGVVFIGANVIGGYGVGTTIAGANRITPGVAGATISGGGGSQSLFEPPQFRPNTVTDDFGTVGGGLGNTAGNGAGTTADAVAATVGGGIGNIASGESATVGGGHGNLASGQGATVGGGLNNGPFNNASGGTGGSSTIAGGQNNTASGFAATVGGGFVNNAHDDYSTIGGGGDNIASGQYAAVPGGFGNVASGGVSFAAGCEASAKNNGSFVWDGSGVIPGLVCEPVSDTGPGQFIALAPGGAIFYSNTGLTAGVTLAAGGSSWKMVSDRNLKRGFEALDGNDLLAKINRIPMSTWSYKAQDPSIRHMGPMAQDFYAAFHLGEDDKHIEEIDGQGVALAGVQALYRLGLEKDKQIRVQQEQIRHALDENRAQQAEIEKLRAEVRQLRQSQTALSALETRLEQLEAREQASNRGERGRRSASRRRAGTQKGPRTELARLHD